MSPAPFRFAVQSFSAASAREWRELARRTEDLGYAALYLADHFLGPGPQLDKTAHPPQPLAAVPAIAVAMAATSTLRVGARVFCMDYRHPVMLAKEAATLDLLSEGRMELGLGAGWLEAEYEAAGLRFDPAAIRIERLQEYLDVVKACLSGRALDHRGRYFRVFGFSAMPTPVQRPHPPIMIGGGSRRVLTLAAREADVVSFNYDNRSGRIGREGFLSSTAERTDQKVAWVRAAAAARREPPALEIGAYLTFVTERPRQLAGEIAAQLGVDTDCVLAHPHALIGSVDSICELLEQRRERYGIARVTVLEDGGNDVARSFAPVVARLCGK